MDKIQVIQSGFNGGIDRDTNFNKYEANKYFYAENLRMITEEQSSSGALVNMKDPIQKLICGISGILDQTILGVVPVRDYLVVFSLDQDDKVNIYLNKEVKNDSGSPALVAPTSIGYPNADPTFSLTKFRVVFSEALNGTTTDFLNYTKTDEIIGIGRYESDEIIKVYWIDKLGKYPLRVINVIYNVDTNPLNLYTASDFDMVGNIDLSTPVFTEYTTGNLDSGKICYSYQLYKKNSNETVFSPHSVLIPIAKIGAYNASLGLEKDINSGVGCRCSISGLDTNYNRIRIVAIHYKDLTIAPEIRIIDERDFAGSTISFIDDGSSLGSYTVEEFTAVAQIPYKAKTIETKDNILFLGNITVDNFDVEYDARAFRFRDNSGTYESKLHEQANYLGEYYILKYESSQEKYYHYNSTGGLINSGTGWNNIPETANLINPFNDISLDYVASDTYNRAADTTLDHTYTGLYGGSGHNVSFQFETTTHVVNNPTGGYHTHIELTQSEFIDNISLRGFKRDEIYRFGIVLFNVKGQASPVKWISDIRMPNNDTHPYISFNNTSKIITANNLFVSFTVSNLPAEVVSYQLVYVERTNINKTCITQGIINNMWHRDYDNKCSPLISPFYFNSAFSIYHSDIYGIITPEIIYKENPQLFDNSDYIECKGYLLSDFLHYVGSPIPNEDWTLNDDVIVGYYKLNYTNQVIPKSKEPIYNHLYVTSEFSNVVDKPYSKDLLATDYDIRLRSNNYLGTNAVPQGQTASHLMIKSKRGLFTLGVENGNPLIDIKRALSNQYGGATYVDRSNSVYIPCSYIDDNTANRGDTFIQMMEVLWAMDAGSSESNTGGGDQVCVMYLPLESTVNVMLRDDYSISRLSSHSKRYLKELAGVWGNINNTLIQPTPLYQLNTVYNRVDNIKTYYPLLFDFNTEDYFDNRVYHSDTKYNGEYTDSWLKFRVANRIEVDSKYGAINKLLNHNNILTFFQDKGFGTLAVNQRSLLQDNNVSQLVLGTGAILERYDMLSTNYGATSHFHVTDSNVAIYFYDEINNKVIRFVGDEEELSVLNGVNSVFDKIQPKSSLVNNDVTVGYNPKFREVYITSYHDTKGRTDKTNIPEFTLLFSEFTGKFMTFFTTIPDRYINNLNFYSYGKGNTEDPYIYMHDVGYRLDCRLEYVITPKENKICIFDNVDLVTEVYGADVNYYDGSIDVIVPYGQTVHNTIYHTIFRNYSGGVTGSPLTITSGTTFNEVDPVKRVRLWKPVGLDEVSNVPTDSTAVFDDNVNSGVIDETIDTIRFTTNHHDTGTLDLTQGNFYFNNSRIKKRFRTWRVLVERAWDFIRSKRTEQRLRDNYLKTDITFKANYTKKFVLHDITTYFRETQL